MRLPLGATPIFDLPPIVAAIRPDLFTYRPVCLSINTDTKSEHYGRTSVDLLGVPNAEICMAIDVSHSSYKLLLLHVLRALGKNTVRRDVEALPLCITRSISTYATTKLIQDFFVNKHYLSQITLASFQALQLITIAQHTRWLNYGAISSNKLRDAIIG